MSKVENLKVFYDTENKYNEILLLQESIKATESKTQIIPENYPLNVNLNRFEKSAIVTVSKKRTLEAAYHYNGEKTAVLNFASSTNPGGGVTKGSSAQEEALCRISTLYPCLNTMVCMNEFYLPHRAAQSPIHNGDIIYTPDITVFKTDDDKPKDLAPENWYNIDVITCAAPNLRTIVNNPYNPDETGKPVKVTDVELLEIHIFRFRRIMAVAAMNGCDNIILGAFGCGAFRNSPEVVARAAKSVIPEFRHAFKNIEFAIYCNAYNEENYKVFERVLRLA